MPRNSCADLPVLEEWHFNEKYRRPKECGVVGCAAQLSTPYQKRYRICAAHMSSAVVLCRGTAQRWCARCRHFEALGAFHGCQRCVPDSQLRQALHTFRADLMPPRRVGMCSLRLSKVPCCVLDAWLTRIFKVGALSEYHALRGRSCIVSLEAERKREARNRAAAAAARRANANPAAAPAAEAAPLAELLGPDTHSTTEPNQLTQHRRPHGSCGSRAGPVSCPLWASARVAAHCTHRMRNVGVAYLPAHSPA